MWGIVGYAGVNVKSSVCIFQINCPALTVNPITFHGDSDH